MVNRYERRADKLADELEPETLDAFRELCEALETLDRERRVLIVNEAPAGSTRMFVSVANVPMHNMPPLAAVDWAQMKSRLFTPTFGSGQQTYTISPQGRALLAYLRSGKGDAAMAVQEPMLRLLSSNEFEHRYPNTSVALRKALDSFVDPDNPPEESSIGHELRTVFQEFAEEAVHVANGDLGETKRIHTKVRLKIALAEVQSKSAESYATALADLAEVAIDLVQKQTHVAETTDTPTYEDCRRAMFATVSVLYEVDRLIS